jgi:hypothetical protein
MFFCFYGKTVSVGREKVGKYKIFEKILPKALVKSPKWDYSLWANAFR